MIWFKFKQFFQNTGPAGLLELLIAIVLLQVGQVAALKKIKITLGNSVLSL